MQEQVNKNIEVLTDKMMQEVSKEAPSIDLTTMVMSKVEALESKEVTTYKPLIPRNLWYLVSFIIIAITGYLMLNNPGSEASWFSSIDFSKLTNNTFTESYSSFQLPKTVLYAILFLGLMVCIQVPVLKHYFDKRLSV